MGASDEGGTLQPALSGRTHPPRAGGELRAAVEIADVAAELALGFDVLITPERDRVRIEPVGDLDLATAPKLHSSARELLDVGFGQLIIDLRRLAFIDAAGIGVLHRIDREARDRGRRILLVQGRQTIRRVFELTDTLARLPFTTDEC